MGASQSTKIPIQSRLAQIATETIKVLEKDIEAKSASLAEFERILQQMREDDPNRGVALKTISLLKEGIDTDTAFIEKFRKQK